VHCPREGGAPGVFERSAAGTRVKIRTEYVYPPIPIRDFDWSAVDDDTYDGAPDAHCPIGRGRTEKEAIDDLLEQLANT